MKGCPLPFTIVVLALRRICQALVGDILMRICVEKVVYRTALCSHVLMNTVEHTHNSTRQSHHTHPALCIQPYGLLNVPA